MTGTLHEDLSTFMTTSRSVLLRMRNVSDKSCRENKNAQFVFSNVFVNTLRTGDADLRFYITTVQDG